MIKTTACNSCDAAIVWMETDAGRNMPVDADSVDEAETEVIRGNPIFSSDAGHISHFSTCPNADKHRRAR